MKIQPHYPYPSRRNEFSDNKIFFIKSDSLDYISFTYQKNTSVDAIIIANQYFSIEEILLESFQYVTPIFDNRNTTSPRFATIIRESCNLYELICKKAYQQFFENDEQNSLNIYNYLSLERFFKINDEEIRSAIFHTYLGEGERIRPFDSLSNWLGNSKLSSEHIPDWWTAYNKIKHDVVNMIQYANMHNAIYSIAALFLIIRKVYGDGLISGYLRKPTDEINIREHLLPIRTSNVFIGEIFKSGKRK